MTFARTLVLLPCMASLGWMAPCHGAGFQISSTSGAGLGNAFAGGAAAAEDASTLWSNAAGIAELKLTSTQIVLAGHLIAPSLKFRDEGSSPAANQPLGGTGGDAGQTALVPNLYVVHPIRGTAWSVGLGVNTPWGLGTKYDAGWIGRFQAQESEIKTININPTVGWKPAEALALGLGLNIQSIDAKLISQVNYSGALLNAAAQGGIAPGSANFNAIAAATPGLQSRARITGDDRGLGWNAGLLWKLDAQGLSRLGLSYRSGISYHIKGKVRFGNPDLGGAPGSVAALANAVNAAALFDSPAHTDVKLPAVANVSYFRTMGAWDIMADAQWTRWSNIQALSFVRDSGAALQSTALHFRNSWRLSAGANHRLNDTWTLRGGLAYDQTPVRAELRTIRLPDADRIWLTAGAQYRLNNKRTRIDVGAAYIHVKNAAVQTSGSPPSVTANGLVKGRYSAHSIIASAQMTHEF